MNDQIPQDIGAALKSARERSGLSLRNIADTTKLQVSALKALEENRISQLPAGIYRRAIVRAYAAEVGLDPQAMLRAFLASYPDDVPSSTMVAQTETRRIPRVLQAVLSIAGAIIPVVAGAFYFTSTAADSDARRPMTDTVATRSAPPAEALVAPASLADAAAGSLSMMISVSARTRLAVIADGHEVVARQLEPGEVVRLNASDDIVLMGDNAGAVNFSINGRPGRTLGADGAPLSARISRSDYLSWLIQQ